VYSLLVVAWNAFVCGRLYHVRSKKTAGAAIYYGDSFRIAGCADSSRETIIWMVLQSSLYGVCGQLTRVSTLWQGAAASVLAPRTIRKMRACIASCPTQQIDLL